DDPAGDTAETLHSTFADGGYKLVCEQVRTTGFGLYTEYQPSTLEYWLREDPLDGDLIEAKVEDVGYVAKQGHASVDGLRVLAGGQVGGLGDGAQQGQASRDGVRAVTDVENNPKPVHDVPHGTRDASILALDAWRYANLSDMGSVAGAGGCGFDPAEVKRESG